MLQPISRSERGLARRYRPKVPSTLPWLREREKSADPIIAIARDFPSGHLVELHRHERAQLIFASAGVMRIDTPQGIWIVPPLRAVWVPAAVDHEIRASTAVRLRTLYVRTELAHALPAVCTVVDVSPLLRELILRLAEFDERPSDPAAYAHMVPLTLEEIRALEALPLHLPMPGDRRLLRICHAILGDPGSTQTCAEWGRIAGASPRTLERLFLKQTGVSFGLWRRQVRLLAALAKLASGTPIMNVAFDLGYNSPSAFTAMFRRALGRPPGAYFRDRHG